LATYQTHQKKELIDFFIKNNDKSYTIDEIVEAMNKDCDFPSPPGKSTIYRLMPSLVETGTVKRFSKGTGRKAYYQLIGDESCCTHMHMKCTSCGKLIHMDDRESLLLKRAIGKMNHFKVDFKQTLIYGTCSCCMEACYE